MGGGRHVRESYPQKIGDPPHGSGPKTNGPPLKDGQKVGDPPPANTGQGSFQCMPQFARDSRAKTRSWKSGLNHGNSCDTI